MHGKGGKGRRVPLDRRVHTAFTAAGHRLAWRSFHAGRKHSGTRLYRATKDFTRVEFFLRHSSVNPGRRYVALEENDVQSEVEDFRGPLCCMSWRTVAYRGILYTIKGDPCRSPFFLASLRLDRICLTLRICGIRPAER